MVAVEFAILVIVAVVITTALASVARPFVQALADRMRFKYSELGSETEVELKQRLNALEQEVRELRGQVTSAQESAEFAVKLIEESRESIKRIEKQES